MLVVKLKNAFILLLVISCFIQPANAKKQGLKQRIITSYLGYSFQPKFRNVFNQVGHRTSFKERNTRFLRDRVTPMLGHFKKAFEFSVGNGVPLIDYNPTLRMQAVSKDSLSKINELKYPANLRWIVRDSTVKGKEFFSLTFKSRPSAEQFMNTVKSFENIFGLKLKREQIKSHKKKKIRLTKKEKEMLEPIRQKQIVLTKYQQYYGIYYVYEGLIEASYISKFTKLINSEFVAIQEQFKYLFYRSKEINIAMNAKILSNLEELIESEEFKDLRSPFEVNESLLSTRFLRLPISREISHVKFLFARKKKATSIIPVLKKMLNEIKLY